MISDPNFDTKYDNTQYYTEYNSNTEWYENCDDNQYDFNISSKYNNTSYKNDDDNNENEWIKVKLNNNNGDHVGSIKYGHNTKCNSNIVSKFARTNRYGVLWTKDDNNVSVISNSDTEYDNKYNDDIHSRKDNDSNKKAANVTRASEKNIKHNSEKNIKHNRTNNNSEKNIKHNSEKNIKHNRTNNNIRTNSKTKTKIDCDITGVHSNKTIDTNNVTNSVDAQYKTIDTNNVTNSVNAQYKTIDTDNVTNSIDAQYKLFTIITTMMITPMMNLYFTLMARNIVAAIIMIPVTVGYQTITLWIYHVHPTRKKRAGHRFNLISQ